MESGRAAVQRLNCNLPMSFIRTLFRRNRPARPSFNHPVAQDYELRHSKARVTGNGRPIITKKVRPDLIAFVASDIKRKAL